MSKNVNEVSNTQINSISQQQVDKNIRDIVEGRVAITNENINSINSQGNTPLHLAIYRKRYESAKELIRKGAVMIPNNNNLTPLELLASSNAPESADLVKEIIDAKKTNISLRGENGNTPLHYAIRSCNIDVVMLLVQNHALNIPNNDGVTPSAMAISLELDGITHMINSRDNTVTVQLPIPVNNDVQLAPPNPQSTAVSLHRTSIQNALQNHNMSSIRTIPNVNHQIIFPNNTLPQNTFHSYLPFSTETDHNSYRPGITDINIPHNNRSISQNTFDNSDRPLTGNTLHTNNRSISQNTSTNSTRTFDGNTTLHYALMAGRINQARYLINQTASNAMNNQQVNPLMIAAEKGYLDIVQTMLMHNEFRSTLNLQNSNGDTALHIALYKKNFDIALLLAQNGAFNIANRERLTPLLIIAAHKEHIDIAKEILKHFSNINYQDRSGDTALHIALKKGNVDMAIYLIQNAAQNIENSARITPLMLAIKEQRAIAIKMLKYNTFHTNLNAQDPSGNSLLNIAIDKACFDIAVILVKLGALSTINIQRMTSLMVAIQKGSMDLVEEMLKHDTFLQSINVQDVAGNTALHIAMQNKNDWFAQVLLEHGANNIANFAGKTPGNIAFTLRKHIVLSDMYRLKKIDINARDENGNTLLHTAIAKDDFCEIDNLLQKGAQNIANNNGITPLILVVEMRSIITLGKMLQIPSYKDDINVRYISGETLLHKLLTTRNNSNALITDVLIKILITNGANNQASFGVTPWEMAINNKNFAVIEVMVEKYNLTSCDVNFRNATGNTVLHLLIEYFGSFKKPKDMLEKLLNIGVLNIPNNEKITPFMLSIKFLHIEIAHLFLNKEKVVSNSDEKEKMVKINEVDIHNNTALHYAIEVKRIDLIEKLLTLGAKSIKNLKGFEPIASAMNNDEIISLFFKYNAIGDINHIGAHGYTVLRHFVLSNNIEMVKKLIIMGVKNQQDIDGETPFDLAIKNENSAMVNLFFQEGLVTSVSNITFQHAQKNLNRSLIIKLLIIGGSSSYLKLLNEDVILTIGQFRKEDIISINKFCEFYLNHDNPRTYYRMRQCVMQDINLQNFLSRGHIANDMLVKIFNEDMNIFFSNCKQQLEHDRYYVYIDMIIHDDNLPVNIRKIAIKNALNDGFFKINLDILMQYITNIELPKDMYNKEEFFNIFESRFSFLKLCYEYYVLMTKSPDVQYVLSCLEQWLSLYGEQSVDLAELVLHIHPEAWVISSNMYNKLKDFSSEYAYGLFLAFKATLQNAKEEEGCVKLCKTSKGYLFVSKTICNNDKVIAHIANSVAMEKQDLAFEWIKQNNDFLLLDSEDAHSFYCHFKYCVAKAHGDAVDVCDIFGKKLSIPRKDFNNNKIIIMFANRADSFVKEAIEHNPNLNVKIQDFYLYPNKRKLCENEVVQNNDDTMNLDVQEDSKEFINNKHIKLSGEFNQDNHDFHDF